MIIWSETRLLSLSLVWLVWNQNFGFKLWF